MNDERKTKRELVAELAELRQRLEEANRRIAELEVSETPAERTQVEERNRALYELSPDGVVTVGLDGRITECNQAYAEMVGYSREDLVGFEYQDIMPPSWRALYERILQEVMERGYSYEFEKEYVRKNGTVFSVSLRTWRIDDESGHPIGVWSIARDITERKRVEEELRRYSERLEGLVEDKTRTLRESGENFRSLAENAGDGILIGFVEKGILVYANKRAAEITGYDAAELLKIGMGELLHPDEYKRMVRAYRKSRAGKDIPRQYETVVIRKDGGNVPVEMTVTQTIWHGQPAVLAIIRDIAERIRIEAVRARTEEALRESEEKFRSLAEQSPNMIFINVKGQVVYANRQCEEVTGYGKDEFYAPDFSFLTLIAPEDQELIKTVFADHMRGKETEPYEYSLITRDGRRVEVIITTRLIDYEGEKAILGIVTDITELKRAERSLRESEEMYKTLVDTSPVAVTMTDLEGRISYVSRQTVELHRATHAEELLGKSAFELIAPEDHAEAAANLEKTLVEGVVRDLEYTLLRRDGSRFAGELNAAVIKDTLGRPKAFIATTEDISERVRIQEVRAQAEKALREYADRLSLLRQIDRAILEARSPEEIAQAALHHIRLLVSCQRASVAVFDPDAREASILASIPGESASLSPGTLISLEPFGNILAGLQRGETYVIDDIVAYPQPPPIVQAQQAAGVRAYACVPLVVQGELVGALSLSADVPACFGQVQIEIAQELANHLAIVIQQARLHEQVQRHAEELERRVAERTRDLKRRTTQLQVAAEVARDATTAHNLDDLLNRVVNLVRDRFGFYHAGIFLTDKRGEYAVLRAATGEAGRQMLEAGHKLKVGEVGIVGYVTSSGQPHIALDVGADTVHFENPFLPATCSEMALPLTVGGQIIGALDVQSVHEAAFGEDDEAALQIMADQLAVAIERTRLFERVEATLEERLRTVVANAPIVLCAMDHEGMVTLAEGKGLERLGVKPGEHVGQSIFDLYRNMPEILENVHRALAGEAVAPVVQVGSLLFESWYSPVRDESGEITGVISVATDVTERRRAEEALRESEEKYRLVSENIPVVVYSALPDEHSTNLFLSGKMEELTSYPSERFLQDPQLWTTIVHPDDRALVWEKIEEHRKNKGSLNLEYRIVTKDGTIKWIKDRATPVIDEAGEILRIDGFMEDITEHKHLENQMRQQERLAAVGQLAGGIAHDFNNFLTTIMLYAQILLRKPGLPLELAPVAQTILEESRRAAQLVRRVLDFSRRSILEMRPVDLAPFVAETVSILQRTLPENIRLLAAVEAGQCTANADPTRIQQVVMNLALNARDAMPDGGELRIGLSRVEVRPEGEPPVADMACGEWVCLTISDTGTGMTDEVRSHLFEPFFTTKGPKGTGLGLAQVYGVVKQHGGHIKVETQVGQGTTFWVYLPAHGAAQAEESRQAASAFPQGKGEVILLVEDEDRVREAGQEILESLGYRVLTAADGQKALQVYRSAEKVDLVLTDMIMPEMGGKELAQELAKIDPHIRVLAITGYTLAEDMKELKRAGILDVVHKPFEVDTLAEAVRRYLNAG